MTDDTNNAGTATADAVAAANQAAAGSTLTGTEGNANAPAAELDTLTSASTAAGATTLSGSSPAAKADAEFVADPTSQKVSLAGTSGAAPGTNATGMNVKQPTLKLSPAAAASAGGNEGVDASTASNVNVLTPSISAHPIVQVVAKHTAELKSVVGQQPKSVWLERALKDLQAFEEWVVQHFEEMKRKA